MIGVGVDCDGPKWVDWAFGDDKVYDGLTLLTHSGGTHSCGDIKPKLANSVEDLVVPVIQITNY